jgi:predicted MFS family arabinose efflux permease
MIIGSILNLGVFIRLLSLINPSQGYSALLIGQIFPALSMPFFSNSPALLAARWFAPSQRDLATAIASMANPIGNAIGTLLPSLIITDDNPTSNQFLILLSAEAVFTLLTTLLIIIIFRSDPPTPPSPSEEHHQPIQLKEDFIKLMKNIHYLTLLFGFSLGLAVFNSLTTLLYQLIEPSGYTSDDAGMFGAIIIVSGLLNAFIAGVIMDKTHAYRIILKTLLVGACASGIFFVIILRPNEKAGVAAAIGLMGFFLLPLLPVSFECAVECTYPIRAEWSTGLLMCVGNTLGGIFIFVVQYLITLAPKYKPGQIFTPAAIFMLSIYILSVIALLIYRGPYLRLEAEKQARSTPVNA